MGVVLGLFSMNGIVREFPFYTYQIVGSISHKRCVLTHIHIERLVNICLSRSELCTYVYLYRYKNVHL